MTLQQKILAALAGSTSRKPMSTAQLRAELGKDEPVLTTLGQLFDQTKVGHCRSIKGDESSDYWWLSGNVESKMLPQTAAANRRTKAARAAKGKR